MVPEILIGEIPLNLVVSHCYDYQYANIKAVCRIL